MKRHYYLHQLQAYLLILHLTSLVLAEQECSSDRGSSYCSLDGGEHEDKPAASHLTSGVFSNSCFRAGVVEHSRVDITEDCQLSIDANLDILEKTAKLSRQNGAKMLVFPEDGLLRPTSTEYIVSCLEDIPDPELLDETNNNPCISAAAASATTTTPGIFHSTPILTRLSCIAKRYALYLVANFGTKQECDNNSTDNVEMASSEKRYKCPSNERDFMMLNTNVVFNPGGQFIKRYRKWHPFFGSEIFDKAPRLERTYFDTSFGRFGLFTCFDMIYRDPAIDLVEDIKIDTAVFPTWWYDELPILTAIQYQDGWSATNRVNLLAANILKPSLGSTGSGIFSLNNSLYVSQSSRNGGGVSKTKILIANLKSRPRLESESVCEDNFEPQIIDLDDNQTEDVYKPLTYNLLNEDKLNTLEELEATKTLCSGEFCCTLNYKLANDTNPNDVRRLVFIVRNSRRPGLYKWFEQTCALSVLEKPVKDTAELVRSVSYDSYQGARFLRLSLEAKFNTKYVYPSAARDNSHLLERKRRRLNCEELVEADEKKLHNCKMELVSSSSDNQQQTLSPTQLYAFAIYGRIYEQDPL